MMFEATQPTSERRKELLLRSLELHSTKKEHEVIEGKTHISVPASLIATHGELDHRLRYAYNAAGFTANKEQLKAIRELKRQLDILPGFILESLQASGHEVWLGFFKMLIRIHQLSIEAKLYQDLEEYETTLRLLTQLAEELVEASSAQVNAASILSFMLLENHMQAAAKKRRTSIRSRRKK
ncbi:MAG: hypothetical protein R3Y56_02935 [Akkermansia sp.]